MSSNNPLRICDMKALKWRELEQILDVNEGWKRLAESLGKTALEVANLELEFRRPGGSPTEMLLTNWGHSDATVEMLVSHLLRAGLRYAAEKLRLLVPDSIFDDDDNGTNADDHNDGHLNTYTVGSVMLDDTDLPLPNLVEIPKKPASDISDSELLSQKLNKMCILDNRDIDENVAAGDVMPATTTSSSSIPATAAGATVLSPYQTPVEPTSGQ